MKMGNEKCSGDPVLRTSTDGRFLNYSSFHFDRKWSSVVIE
jgi:hypothetical protein